MNTTPPIADMLYAAAVRRAASADPAGARTLLDEALLADPSHAAAAQKLAELLIFTDPPRAVSLARAVLADHPNNTELLATLAQALSELGENNEVAATFLRAVEIEPDNGRLHSNAALSLLRTGRLHESLAAARQAIELEPTLATAHANLGHVLNALRKYDDAIAAFVASLALWPDNPDVLSGIGTAETYLGRPSAALLARQRSAAFRPTNGGAHTEVAGALQELGAHDDALATHRYAITLSPDDSSCSSNLLMAMQYVPDVTEPELVAEAAAWGLRASRVPLQPRHAAPLDPDRRLRIGYVTTDLYSHPVGWLGAGPIASHHRPDFSVFVYANQTVADSITRSVMTNVDAWRHIYGISDATVAQAIANDGIDILVDLSGHTGGNRLNVFARRPAPVQLHWLGYFATIGLPSIETILLDDEHIAPGGEAQFTERVVRLRHGRFCYGPPASAPEPAPPPSEASGVVTFGSFNNANKLNDATLDLWARVLAAVPGSRLLLKWRSMTDPVLSSRLRDAMASRGLPPDRLLLEGEQPHPEMLARYGQLDIALDPMPFSGALTSFEALWMGVPVVTLPGRRAVSRQTHAILSRISAQDWSGRALSAGSEDEFVAIAAALAGDIATRRRLRTGLRAMLRDSPMFDPVGFVTELERVYRELWREYCARSPAGS